MNHRRRRSFSRNGFSLVEAMVALLVLSVGLLGLAMLQAQGMRFNTESYMRSQATILAYEIIDRMRANPGALAAGSYDIATSSAAGTALTNYRACRTTGCACSAATSCDSANLALHDLGKWLEAQVGDTANGLPAALAVDTSNYSTIARAGTLVTVTMRWMELRGDSRVPVTQAWEVVIN